MEFLKTLWYLWPKVLNHMKLDDKEKEDWTDIILHSYGSELLTGDEEWLGRLLDRASSMFKKSPLKNKVLVTKISMWKRALLNIFCYLHTY